MTYQPPTQPTQPSHGQHAPTQPVHGQHAPTQPVHGQLAPAQPTMPVAYPDYLDRPPPRRSNGPLLAVVVALAVLLVGGIGVAGMLLIDGGTDGTDTTADNPTYAPTTSVEQSRPAAPATAGGKGKGRVVVYEVTGDGPVSIVYLKEDGRTPAQARDADLPWRMELTLEDKAPRVTVTAIRGALSDGTIECRVTVDGKEVAKRSASGTFATATCTDRV